MTARPDVDDDPFPVRRREVRRAAEPGLRPRSRRRPSARVRRRRAAAGALALGLLLWGGVSGVRALTHGDSPAPAADVLPTTSPTATASATAQPSPSDSPTRSPSDSPTPSPSDPGAGPAASPSPASGLAGGDLAAGLLDRTIPQRGTGKLVTVPGEAAAPGKGKLVRVRVQIEGGLHVDGQKFAAFALATLNDPRSWPHDGYRFARTDSSSADVNLVLASPQTSAKLCLPLKTMGTLSCHSGDDTVLTLYRWVLATPDYHGDLEGYRHYVVNHEVGHALGHAHEYCAGPGKRAPVMMQQTKGLKGCKPNPWPYP